MMRITAEFKIVTPVFCAGAEKNGPSEIREFAIKGMLRWFYRALDGSSSLNSEGKYFGSSSGNGQASPLVLRLEKRITGNRSYENELKPSHADTDGACYLGYSLYLGENKRSAIEPEKSFHIILEPLWEAPSKEVIQAWVAALWLLGHLGGIGSRMRRGFGTIALIGLDYDGVDISSLPLPNNCSSIDEWRKEFDAGLRILRQWFPNVRKAGSIEPTIANPLRLLIGPPFDDWLSALRHIGNLMRNFRTQKPKYPRNAAFGLPLTSRSMQDTIIPQEREFERSPSRLWIRILYIAGKYHPMVWLQESSLLPRGGIRWKKGKGSPPNLQIPAGLGVLPDFILQLRNHRYL